MEKFRLAWDAAVAAGNAAAAAKVPVPMVVVQHANPLNDASPVVKVYEPVMDGVCGFAWVKIRPANKPFANWLKKQGLAKPAYGGGLQYWVSAFNQSMEKKEAFAYAMADSLGKAFPDMKFYGQSRMD